MKPTLHETTDLTDILSSTGHVYSLIVEGATNDGTSYQAGISEDSQVLDNNCGYLRPMVFISGEGEAPVCYVGVRLKEYEDKSFFDGIEASHLHMKERMSELNRVLQQYIPKIEFKDSLNEEIDEELPTFQHNGHAFVAQLPSENPHINNVHMKVALMQSFAAQLGFTITKVYYETV